MIVVRGKDPGPFSRHRDYAEFLQVTFNCRCAYCLTPDKRLGGLEAMKVDHFRPESRYKKLRLAWINLYYSCDVCNNRKSDHPRAEEEKQGKQLVDICHQNSDDHFQLTLDVATGDHCLVTHLSEPGRYTIFRLQFNRRKFLRDFWREIHSSERRTLERLAHAEVIKNQLSATDPEACQLIADLELELVRIRDLRPFPLSGQKPSNSDTSR